MKKFVTATLIYLMVNFTQAQAFEWTVTAENIYRDGVPFFMNGQSWAKQTPLTYDLGISAELTLKQKLSELNAIGVNTLRIYGSPDDNDWSGSDNYGNLIRWIEEWNESNPDAGDPNKAIYYIVQINPQDDQSTISDLLPNNNSASFNRAIHDTANPASIASLTSQVNDITDGSKYLLGYMIYHELNGSNKYYDWYEQVGASGIEAFMNAAADALHDTYATGKLVTHTGDAKQPTVDIYEQIENLDSDNGNVFAHFDLLGFNLYISTKEMLNEGTYYNRIPQRRDFSVNSNRGWYIGETGASSDVDVATSIPAVNYTNEQGLANLQLMWQKSEALGNMIGFMLFTVQDNDLGSDINDDMKQRGYFDVYGDQKYLYHAYADVINEISSNERFHYSDDHIISLNIIDGINEYTTSFNFENKSQTDLTFSWSIYGDDGSSNQRFTNLIGGADIVIEAGQSTQIERTLIKSDTDDLFLVSAALINEISTTNAYSWGREHLYGDAISTIAGLNYKTDNIPELDDSYNNSGTEDGINLEVEADVNTEVELDVNTEVGSVDNSKDDSGNNTADDLTENEANNSTSAGGLNLLLIMMLSFVVILKEANRQHYK